MKPIKPVFLDNIYDDIASVPDVGSRNKDSLRILLCQLGLAIKARLFNYNYYELSILVTLVAAHCCPQ